MANWSASLDATSPGNGANPRLEAANSPVGAVNCVAYITFSSDDAVSRTVKQRVPYPTEDKLLVYCADVCTKFSAIDDHNIAAADVVAGTKLVAGPIDLTLQLALVAATNDLQQKMGPALQQKQIADATVIDPTIADAVAAQQNAQTAISAVISPPIKVII